MRTLRYICLLVPLGSAATSAYPQSSHDARGSDRGSITQKERTVVQPDQKRGAVGQRATEVQPLTSAECEGLLGQPRLDRTGQCPYLVCVTTDRWGVIRRSCIEADE